MLASLRRPIVVPSLVLFAIVTAALLNPVASQTGGTPTTTSGGTTTYSSIGSTSYTTQGSTGHGTITTSSETTSWATIQEGFEHSNGPYHLAASNATVLFSNQYAAGGSRSLSIDCANPCYADLWFDLEGWLTYTAAIQYMLKPNAAQGQLSLRAGPASASWGLGPSNQTNWYVASLQISACVQSVHFTWTGAAGTLYLDQVNIDRSTTTQSTSGSDGGCGETTTTPYCEYAPPYKTNGMTVTPTCPPPTTTTTMYPCGPVYSPSPTTCYPTDTTYSAPACWDSRGARMPCPSQGTVTVTKTVSVPNLTAWATLGVLVAAAALAAARRR